MAGQAKQASYNHSQWFRQRCVAFLALCVPTLSGIVFLIRFGAPQSYVIVNAGALFTALLAIAVLPLGGGLSRGLAFQRALAIALLIVLAAPLAFGPDVEGVRRWISIGGFSLHAGSLVIPLLVCLAARDREFAAPILLTGVLICLIQPDAASAFAFMLASVGLYFAWVDWKPGVVAIIGFASGLLASVRGELPPQAFVERIFGDLIPVAPWFALWLGVSVLIGFLLILKALPRPPAERFALAGALAGFSLTALMSSYPSVLIAYGAAPILGFGLALAHGDRGEGKEPFLKAD